MIRFISWLIMTPLAVVVVVFTVANRGRTTLDLWPLPVTMDVPVSALGLVGGFAGFLAGALVAWLSGRHKRAQNRKLVRQLEAAKREQAALRNRIEQLEQSPPALPHSRADAA